MVCTWKTCVDSKRVQEECLLSVFFFFFFLVCAVPSAAPQNLSLEVRNSKVKLYIAVVHFYW